MGAAMTLIEFIGGLSFVNKSVKLWDYSNNWGNYKGIICPLFSLIWTFISALYYFFLSEFILDKVIWFNNHIIFSLIFLYNTKPSPLTIFHTEFAKGRGLYLYLSVI